MSFKAAFKKLVDSSSKISSLTKAISKESSHSSPGSPRHKPEEPRLRSRASPLAARPLVRSQTAPHATVTKPVAIRTCSPLPRAKSVGAVFSQEIKKVESVSAPRELELPLHAVKSEQQKDKLELQWNAVPRDERRDYAEFLQLVEEGREEDKEQFAQCFRGTVSLRQALDKFARPFVEEKWKLAQAECPWPPSARLDVQLHLMEDLPAVNFMLALKADPDLAKAAFSHPAAKTLEQGKAIFDLYRSQAGWLKQRPDLVSEFISTSAQDRAAFLKSVQNIEASDPGLAESILTQNSSASLQLGLMRILNALKNKGITGHATELLSSPKSAASKALEPSSPGRAVRASSVGIQPGTEKVLVAGFISTDRPSELSKRALGELTSGDDDTKVLCAGPVNDLTGFGPRDASDNVENEAKACADYLLWHPVVGRHLVDQVKGSVVTVGDLKLALKKVREDF